MKRRINGGLLEDGTAYLECVPMTLVELDMLSGNDSEAFRNGWNGLNGFRPLEVKVTADGEGLRQEKILPPSRDGQPDRVCVHGLPTYFSTFYHSISSYCLDNSQTERWLWHNRFVKSGSSPLIPVKCIEYDWTQLSEALGLTYKSSAECPTSGQDIGIRCHVFDCSRIHLHDLFDQRQG